MNTAPSHVESPYAELSGSAIAQSASPGSESRRPTDSFLHVSRRRVRDGVEVCVPVGDIDLGTAPILQRALHECDQHRVARVVVDLTAVSFMAVAGARALVAATEEAVMHRRWLTVVAAETGPARRVLEVSGLSHHVVMSATLSDALADDRPRDAAPPP